MADDDNSELETRYIPEHRVPVKFLIKVTLPFVCIVGVIAWFSFEIAASAFLFGIILVGIVVMSKGLPHFEHIFASCEFGISQI